MTDLYIHNWQISREGCSAVVLTYSLSVRQINGTEEEIKNTLTFHR